MLFIALKILKALSFKFSDDDKKTPHQIDVYKSGVQQKVFGKFTSHTRGEKSN